MLLNFSSFYFKHLPTFLLTFLIGKAPRVTPRKADHFSDLRFFSLKVGLKIPCPHIIRITHE